MDTSRKTAYDVLLDVEKRAAYSNLALNRRIRAQRPETEAFVRELVYGVLTWQRWLDAILDRYVHRGFAGVKPPLRVLLRMGLYQLLYMDSVPDHAAVSETVSLSRHVAPGRESFINGVLRSCVRDRERLCMPPQTGSPVEDLAVRYSYDPWIVELWLTQYGAAQTESMLAAGNTRPTLSVRVNLCRTTCRSLAQTLERDGFQVRASSLSDRVLLVNGSRLLETKAYRDGLFSVQDAASTLAADLLAPEPGDLVLDLCSAPGGKTLAMAEQMRDQGQIVAFDLYAHKLKLLEREAARLGLTVIETAVHDATADLPQWHHRADRVLVDAPCSGLGVIRRKPEIKYRALPDAGRGLAEQQLCMLEHAARCLRPGGSLLYSTCTVNEIENRQVIERFLDAQGGQFRLCTARQLLPGEAEADGFFLCKLERM